MKCDFNYCIYNEDYKCKTKEIQINLLGMCEKCIIVSISEVDLKALKEEQLKKLEIIIKKIKAKNHKYKTF